MAYEKDFPYLRGEFPYSFHSLGSRAVLMDGNRWKGLWNLLAKSLRLSGLRTDFGSENF